MVLSRIDVLADNLPESQIFGVMAIAARCIIFASFPVIYGIISSRHPALVFKGANYILVLQEPLKSGVYRPERRFRRGSCFEVVSRPERICGLNCVLYERHMRAQITISDSVLFPAQKSEIRGQILRSDKVLFRILFA